MSYETAMGVPFGTGSGLPTLPPCKRHAPVQGPGGMKGLGEAPSKRTVAEHLEESVIQQQARLQAASPSMVPWLLFGAGALVAGGLAFYLFGRKAPKKNPRSTRKS